MASSHNNAAVSSTHDGDRSQANNPWGRHNNFQSDNIGPYDHTDNLHNLDGHSSSTRPEPPQSQQLQSTIRQLKIEEPSSPMHDAKLSPYITPMEHTSASEIFGPSSSSGAMHHQYFPEKSEANFVNHPEKPQPELASLRSAELQECETESDAFSPSPDMQWASASIDHTNLQNDPPQPSHIYHSLNEQDTPDLQFGHEIKRNPQSVQVSQINNSDRHRDRNQQQNERHAVPEGQRSSHAPHSYQHVFETALQESDGQSTESFGLRSDSIKPRNASTSTSIHTYGGEEEDDTDEDPGHTSSESLPTPRMNSPRLSIMNEPHSAPSRSSNNTSYNAMLVPPKSSSASTSSSSRRSVNSASALRGSYSPQQSSSSDHSASPKMPQQPQQSRPKSIIGNRAANRQSFFDFSGTTNNINLNLSDAVAAQSFSGNSGNTASNASSPRMKTIDLYRKNARKTNDPESEFQLAQYMMQTASMAASEKNHERSRRSSVMSAASAVSNSEPAGPSKPEADKGKSSSRDENKLSAEDKSSDKIIGALFKESVASLKRLSERGFADAQYLSGDVYSSEVLSNKPDMERSFKYFMMAAKHGHAEAAYRAALCSQEGWGTSRDAARAIQFYTKAAVRNQPGASYQLGMAYFYGGMGINDTSANRLAGVKWLSRAVNVSDQTYNRAPHELAKIYEVGFKDLVIPDNAYAAKSYTHAADLGFVPSAARLGRAYEFGESGCPQDPNLSIHYYTIAALGNDPSAQLAMCAWYMVGAGPTFPVNHDEAYEWALRAALNGLPKAQYTLGFFYENGTGTKRNVIEAGKWYRRAAENGFEKAAAKSQNSGVSDNDKRKAKCSIM